MRLFNLCKYDFIHFLYFYSNLLLKAFIKLHLIVSWYICLNQIIQVNIQPLPFDRLVENFALSCICDDNIIIIWPWGAVDDQGGVVIMFRPEFGG